MACAAEMRMTETCDGFILVTVTRTIFINIAIVFSIHFVRDGIRFRA